MSTTMQTRVCPVCGRYFNADGRTKFCSRECKRKNATARMRRVRHAAPLGTTTAVCSVCGCTFTYERTGKPRKRCDRCRGEAAKEAATATAPKRVICLFCGVSAVPKHGGEFCDQCRKAGLVDVYEFRKRVEPHFRSEGEKARERGTPNADRSWLTDSCGNRGSGNQRRRAQVGELAEREPQGIRWAMKARGR